MRDDLPCPPGSEDLVGLKKLYKLNLDETGVTDAGLKELAKLEALTDLGVGHTKVTEQAQPT